MISRKQKGTAKVALAAKTRLNIAINNCFLYGLIKGNRTFREPILESFFFVIGIILEL
jgi:hypothetical protein